MKNERCIVCGDLVNNKEHTTYTYCNKHNGEYAVDHQIRTLM